MQYLFIWLTTIVLSHISKIVMGFNIFKDAADIGYKINTEKIPEMSKLMKDSNNEKFEKIIHLIPFYNMMKAIEKLVDYNNKKSFILAQLYHMGILEELTEDELREYKNNPSAIKAILLCYKDTPELKESFDLSNTSSVTIKNEEHDCEIFYDYDDENLIVIKATGTAQSLSYEEQKELLIDALYTILNEAINEFGSEDAFIEAIRCSSDKFSFDTREYIEKLKAARAKFVENDGNAVSKNKVLRKERKQ